MTKEEKQLLLKELCMRLPYGIKINYKGTIRTLTGSDIDDCLINGVITDDLENIKPYLRSMYSMTEEERKHYNYLLTVGYYDKLIDWLNEQKFDYKFLIPLGIILEAPKEMYKK